VVSHGGVMSVAIPRLTGRATPQMLAARWLPHCGIARVDVDADGWVLHEWPGSADPPTTAAGVLHPAGGHALRAGDTEEAVAGSEARQAVDNSAD